MHEKFKNARILLDSCPKMYQNTRFFKMIFTRKINKIPEFYIIIDRFFPIFLVGGGHVPPCPPAVSYAYEHHLRQAASRRNVCAPATVRQPTYV